MIAGEKTHQSVSMHYCDLCDWMVVVRMEFDAIPNTLVHTIRRHRANRITERRSDAAWERHSKEHIH